MIKFVINIIIFLLSPIIYIGAAVGTIIAGIIFGFICIILYPFIKIHKLVEKEFESF